jgi:hypothetical protein
MPSFSRKASSWYSAQASAAEALSLYPHRWTIERLFFDLKEVLNLNRVYAANPNAVAMQVYAAGCVYNAMRVAQAEVAAAAGLAPEAISPAKFFPKMAAACHAYALFELWFLEARRANPGQRLRKPPPDPPTLRQRRPGCGAGGAAQGTAPKTSLLCGSSPLEVSGSCARWS